MRLQIQTMTQNTNAPKLSTRPSDRLIRDFFIFYNATIVFFAIGIITTLGLEWYARIHTPAWTPPDLVIAAIWGTLLITTVMSLSIFCDTATTGTRAFRNTVLMYMGNALLILVWNYLFFGVHMLVLAVWAAVAVGLSVITLIWRVRAASLVAAWLLAPYLGWVVYAIAINYVVMLMN